MLKNHLSACTIFRVCVRVFLTEVKYVRNTFYGCNFIDRSMFVYVIASDDVLFTDSCDDLIDYGTYGHIHKLEITRKSNGCS